MIMIWIKWSVNMSDKKVNTTIVPKSIEKIIKKEARDFVDVTLW